MITRVHVSSSEILINKEDAPKKSLPFFKKGQTVVAKVLKLLPPGNAQLLVSGQKITAKTSLLLKPGEEVQLKVIEQKDAVILKLISPVQKMTPGQISSLVSMFSKNGAISDLAHTKLANVKSLLHDMALKSGNPDETFLPKLIEKSGLLWEKKVAQLLLGETGSKDVKVDMDSLLKQDVKGNILKALLNTDAHKGETLKQAAAFSKTMENFQLLNHSSSESGRFLLPFPIFSESAFSFGQLFVDTGGKTKKDDTTSDKLIQVSFLLDMSRLGLLRADFSILKKEITGRFLLKDRDTCEYVKSMVPELKIRIESIEYHVHQIECHIAKKEDLHQNSFVETLVKAQDDRVLNIVI